MGLLRWLFNRRSLENPSTSLSDPGEWLVDAWGGGKSAAGIRVNKETALTYSPVWRAVSLISRDVSKLPVFVYRREGAGKERDTRHPAYRLLRHKPNKYINAFTWKQTLQVRAMLQGNGYAYIERRGNAAPAGLYVLDSAKTYPVRINGVVWYAYTGGDPSKPDLIPAHNILHIRGMGDELEGWSVITYARESLGLGIAAQKYGATFFANDARPGMVLEHPAHLSDGALKHLQSSWKAQHSAGEGMAHSPAVLEEGMKANPFQMSNEDAQFLETRGFELREVANWFGVPPHKLGDTTRTSYASLEQENQAYLDEAIDPWLVIWETECWDKLLTTAEQDKDTHVIEFKRQALVRANMKDRSAFYHNALQDGWMSRDEVRGLENMNPIPDGEGEEYFLPLNMDTTGEDVAEDGEEPDGDGEGTEAGQDDGAVGRFRDARTGRFADRDTALVAAHEKLIRDTVGRMARRLGTQAERAAETDEGLRVWLDECLRQRNRDTVIDALRPVLTAAAAACGGSAAAAPMADALLGQTETHLGGLLSSDYGHGTWDGGFVLSEQVGLAMRELGDEFADAAVAEVMGAENREEAEGGTAVHSD